MVSPDRATIMETNRSLRNIKTELENLLEKGVIDENVFDSITGSLPPESSLSGPLRTTANSGDAAASSSPAPATRDHASPPTQGFQNMNLNNSPSPAPPSYNNTPAPGVPPRGATPGRPVIAHARALYRYGATDARDLSFEKDDHVAVYEYMNDDWWMGMNQRTGQEGIFPRSYVLPEQDYKAPPGGYGPPQPQYGYPTGPPQQQNPYNASVPPMAVAEGGGQQQQEGGAGVGGKGGEYGKKFGKKLGNAAIFGAGAAIGGNIVNSIF
ncbi:SH3 domain protein [Cordyceps fumosorosea ARSEF 2679]|uniref:SH3 domain protein n=1 Tax=Cordyceps fumosorosea (strain ARSEF 2679) TaxID=1081104 RepID=A0A167SWW2_CORFA|nr:SH3 domain protein [Cordyceps fumosorosea ARSEF 2679]OAA60011.1 SH3 domain protein [Cordyceps fumosorosea ARSEF 2679]